MELESDLPGQLHDRRSGAPRDLQARTRRTTPLGLRRQPLAARGRGVRVFGGDRMEPRPRDGRPDRRSSRRRALCRGSSLPTSSSTTSRSSTTRSITTGSARSARSTSSSTTPTARAGTACSARTARSGRSTTVSVSTESRSCERSSGSSPATRCPTALSTRSRGCLMEHPVARRTPRPSRDRGDAKRATRLLGRGKLPGEPSGGPRYPWPLV